MLNMKKGKLKQIKSFSVDGDTYLWLVERLKETGEKEFNISALVNYHLNGLYATLKCILDHFDKQKLSIDRAWVINKFFRTWSFMLSEPGEDIKYEANELFIDYHREKRKLMQKKGKSIDAAGCFKCKRESTKSIVNEYGERMYSFCSLLDSEVFPSDGCDHFELKDDVKVVYGKCSQCEHWDLNDEYCSVKKKMVRSFERCESFKAKKGIKKRDLEQVEIKGRMMVTKGSIVID